MPRIQAIHARQILDSRGNPTIEVDVILEDGAMGRAAVPSGASTGAREAIELRDEETAYLGKSVSTACQNVESEIFTAVKNQELDQSSLDTIMKDLDGTPTKSRLGANAILGVSMAFAVACSHSNMQPLYKWLHRISGQEKMALPSPILNVLNGGAHANWTTDIQEYILFPIKDEPYSEQLRKSVEVFHHLGKLLKKANLSVNVGNEGGYAPEFSSNEQAFEMMVEAVSVAGYQLGQNADFMLGIDAAATEFYKDGQYHLKRDGVTKSSAEMVEWMSSLCDKFPIFSLEDPLAESDWDGWAAITARLGQKIQIVGDDLTVTNPQYVQQAIDGHNCNAVIIKLNQVGTVSETFDAINLARKAGWNILVSHRSGETEDTFISHLAVAVAAERIKAGAPSRTDRTAKYNELLRIEAELATQ